jgi:hypothetical protein
MRLRIFIASWFFLAACARTTTDPATVSDDSGARAPSGAQKTITASSSVTTPVAGMDSDARGHGVVGPEGVASFDRLDEASRSRLNSLKVLFGHQSVGQNMIDGAKALGFPFKSVKGEVDFAAPVRGEAYVEENHDPHRKVKSFAALIEGKGIGARADVAGFKLCYVDFYEAAKLSGLRDAYQKQIEAIRAAHPKLRLFHVTPPLTTKEAPENKVRVEFGDWLKKTFSQREVVYDLQSVESTKADGVQCLTGGTRSLCPEYAADEGHLNAEGQKRAAKGLLYAIAKSAGAAP